MLCKVIVISISVGFFEWKSTAVVIRIGRCVPVWFSFITDDYIDVFTVCRYRVLSLTDPSDVEKTPSNVDDNKSSGDELDSREEPYSRSGTDDAAEPGSDSTRDDLSESDLDAGATLEPKSLDEVAPVPVPMPRRRKGGSLSTVPPGKESDEVKPVLPVETGKQKRLAPKRPDSMAHHREKGTD